MSAADGASGGASGRRTLASRLRALRERRYMVLLVLLLSEFVLMPAFEESPNRVLVATTIGSLIFLAAIACLEAGPFRFLTFRWMGFAAFASGWIPLATERPALLIVSAAFRIVFFAIVTGALIYQVAVSRNVTLETIVGAIDGYLLLGFMAAAAFVIESLASEGALRITTPVVGGTSYLYFAFITLATVGYGDIVPTTPAARSLAVLVAIAGQFYVAILISLLVGKYAASRPPGDSRQG